MLPGSYLSLRRSCPGVWPSWSPPEPFCPPERQRRLRREESRRQRRRRRTETLRRRPGALTSALVHQQAAGSSEVDGVVDLQALQVLTHLAAGGEFRVGVFKVDLPAGGSSSRSSVRKQDYIFKTHTHTHDSDRLHLYHQVHEALVVIAGHRSVRTHDQTAVNPGGQVDVLACRGRHADGL